MKYNFPEKLALFSMRVLLLSAFLLLITFFSALFAQAEPLPADFLKSSNNDFAHPHDLVLGPDGNLLYVSDVNHHVIRVIDPLNLNTVTLIGKNELDSPHDVAFDSDGKLLVADSGNDRIVIYALNNKSYTLVDEIKKGMRSPEGVTSDDRGNVYVASTGNHKILKFNKGKLKKSVGGRGDGRKEFVRPHDIELGVDGLLYIGDPGNNRVQVFTTELDYRKTIENKKAPFNEPKYLALDKKGWLYVADQQNNQLRIYNAAGSEVGVIKKAGNVSLNYIEGVEVTSNHIWISDTYNNRVVVFKWSPQ